MLVSQPPFSLNFRKFHVLFWTKTPLPWTNNLLPGKPTERMDFSLVTQDSFPLLLTFFTHYLSHNYLLSTYMCPALTAD